MFIYFYINKFVNYRTDISLYWWCNPVVSSIPLPTSGWDPHWWRVMYCIDDTSLYQDRQENFWAPEQKETCPPPPPPILQIMILKQSPPRCVIIKESVQQKLIDELWFRKQLSTCLNSWAPGHCHGWPLPPPLSVGLPVVPPQHLDVIHSVEVSCIASSTVFQSWKMS